MKNSWMLVGAMAAMTVAHLALAKGGGGMAGNGGDAVVCRDLNDQIVSAEALDVYEGREIREPSMPLVLGSPSDSVETHVETLVSRLKKFSPARAERYRAAMMAMLFDDRLTETVYGRDLIDVPDSDLGVDFDLPRRCAVEQVIIQRLEPTASGKIFKRNGDIWERLDSRSRAVLALHEAILTEMISARERTVRRFADRAVELDPIQTRELRFFAQSLFADLLSKDRRRQLEAVVDLPFSDGVEIPEWGPGFFETIPGFELVRRTQRPTGGGSVQRYFPRNPAVVFDDEGYVKRFVAYSDEYSPKQPGARMPSQGQVMILEVNSDSAYFMGREIRDGNGWWVDPRPPALGNWSESYYSGSQHVLLDQWDRPQTRSIPVALLELHPFPSSSESVWAFKRTVWVTKEAAYEAADGKGVEAELRGTTLIGMRSLSGVALRIRHGAWMIETPSPARIGPRGLPEGKAELQDGTWRLLGSLSSDGTFVAESTSVNWKSARGGIEPIPVRPFERNWDTLQGAQDLPDALMRKTCFKKAKRGGSTGRTRCVGKGASLSQARKLFLDGAVFSHYE